MFKKRYSTEKELVEACINNDRRAQERLYKQHCPAMMRMCMRYTQDQEVALDIVNTGFLRIFKKLHLFGFKGSLEGWMKRLVFHALSDYFKKENKKIKFLDIEDKNPSIEDVALDNLYAEDLLDLAKQLPNVTKEVFWMFAVEGYSHKEIGEELDISVGTSKWHLFNARKKLQSILQKNNSTYNAG